jgi:probable HAF family extracellular repeat protein
MALGCILPAAAEVAWGADFIGLGDLAGGEVQSEAADVSANGVVVGSSRSGNGREAFRWTRETGMVGLGDFPGGVFNSFATAVSADGSVVVGGGNAAPEWTPYQDEGSRAFRWTADSGFTSLVGGPHWTNVLDEIQARGVSADGSVVVGVYRFQSIVYAFRWTEAGGAVTLTGNYYNVAANDVSADGHVMVGEDYLAGGWFEGEQRHRLPQRVDRAYSGIKAASADGSVMGGYSAAVTTLEPEATLWSERGTTWNVIGDLPGGRMVAEVLDLSYDGSIAVGFGHSEVGKEAFIWDQVSGMRSLQRVLVDEYRLDLEGWRLETATGISDDGTVIVGTGVHDGVSEAFVVSIPEPGVLVWVASVEVMRRRVRARRREDGRLWH